MRRMRDEVHYGDRIVRCLIERPPSLDAMFRRAVDRYPQAPALVEGERRLSYAELDARVEAVAGNLTGIGVGYGDRVAVLLGNRIEFVDLALACARLGAIMVPINTRHRLPENQYALQHSGAKVLVHDADQAPNIPAKAALPDLVARYAVAGSDPAARPYADLLRPARAPVVAIAEDDAFCILYTSGTTGKPKGAMLTHLGVIHSCLHFEEAMRLRPGDRSILAVPASHVTGLVAIILTMVRVGGCTVMMPVFKARAFLELAAAERIGTTIMVPAMYNLCLLDAEFDRFDLSHWRIGGYGGAPMPEATIHRLAAKLPDMMLCNAYGATETTSPATIMPYGHGTVHAASVGRTVECGEIRVMDDAGREVAPGESGELWIKGPMVVPGYWHNPEATAQNFIEGHWRSGDIGSVDAEGYVRIFDRKKDMINRAGYKVYSAEVENVLAEHPAVIECAVIGRPDPVLGERTHAFIVVQQNGASIEALKAFCAERLSDYKVPDFISLRSEPLPRNPNGKVLKTALRQSIQADIDRDTAKAATGVRA